jgi:hypothetical protein
MTEVIIQTRHGVLDGVAPKQRYENITPFSRANLVRSWMPILYIILRRRRLVFTGQGTRDPRRERMFARQFEDPCHRRGLSTEC